MQSTKLCVFEERVLEIVAATKNLPGNLATTGELRLPVLTPSHSSSFDPMAGQPRDVARVAFQVSSP